MPAPDGTRAHKPKAVTSTKLLRGFGISAAQQFAISYAHIVTCLRDEGRQRFTLDLLTGGISPAHFDYWRNRCLTDRVSGDFRRLLERFPHVDFASATLVCDVFPTEPQWRIETRVIVVADDGRVWRGGVCEVSSDWPDGSVRYRLLFDGKRLRLLSKHVPQIGDIH